MEYGIDMIKTLYCFLVLDTSMGNEVMTACPDTALKSLIRIEFSPLFLIAVFEEKTRLISSLKVEPDR